MLPWLRSVPLAAPSWPSRRGRSPQRLQQSVALRKIAQFRLSGFPLSGFPFLLSGPTGVIHGGAMKQTTTRKLQKQTPTNGFAIPLTDSTDLGLAMLIAKSEDGQYEPVSVVASIGEAREIAESDLRGRMRRLERGA